MRLHRTESDGGSHRRRLPARTLKPTERLRLAVEIVASFWRARRALRSGPLDAAVATLRGEAAPAPGPAPASSSTLAEASRLGVAVTRTLELLPGDTRCLTRSLVLTQLLARRRIGATLVIGARSAPNFLAHAWVEHAGMPVLPPGEDSFGRLVEL